MSENGFSMSDEGNTSRQSAKHRVPKMSLGKVPKMQTGMGPNGHSFDSATEILGGLNGSRPISSGKAERDVEKTRLHLKSLSLQNGRLVQLSLV